MKSILKAIGVGIVVVLVLAFASSYATAHADTPAPRTHAVMILLTFDVTPDAEGYPITHAQIIGGFPTLDACKDAMPRALAALSGELNANEQPQFECTSIRAPLPS